MDYTGRKEGVNVNASAIIIEFIHRATLDALNR
jgi:hypothetical protein